MSCSKRLLAIACFTTACLAQNFYFPNASAFVEKWKLKSDAVCVHKDRVYEDSPAPKILARYTDDVNIIKLVIQDEPLKASSSWRRKIFDSIISFVPQTYRERLEDQIADALADAEDYAKNSTSSGRAKLAVALIEDFLAHSPSLNLLILLIVVFSLSLIISMIACCCRRSNKKVWRRLKITLGVVFSLVTVALIVGACYYAVSGYKNVTASVENLDCEAHEIVVAAFDTAQNLTRDASALVQMVNSQLVSTATHADGILSRFSANVVGLANDIDKARESYMNAIAPNFFLVGGDMLKEQVATAKDFATNTVMMNGKHYVNALRHMTLPTRRITITDTAESYDSKAEKIPKAFDYLFKKNKEYSFFGVIPLILVLLVALPLLIVAGCLLKRRDSACCISCCCSNVLCLLAFILAIVFVIAGFAVEATLFPVGAVCVARNQTTADDFVNLLEAMKTSPTLNPQIPPMLYDSCIRNNQSLVQTFTVGEVFTMVDRDADTNETCRYISTRLSDLRLPPGALDAFNIEAECHALMNRSIETAVLTAIPLLINKTIVAEAFANEYVDGHKKNISAVLNKLDVRHLTLINLERMAEELLSFLFFSPIDVGAWDLFYAIGNNETIGRLADETLDTIERHVGLLSLSCDGSIDPFINAINMADPSLLAASNIDTSKLKTLADFKNNMRMSTDSCNNAFSLAGVGSGTCVQFEESTKSCVAPNLTCKIFSPTFNSTADIAIFDKLAEHFDKAAVNSLLDKLAGDMMKELHKIPGLQGEIDDLPDVIKKIKSKLDAMKDEISHAKFNNVSEVKAGILRKYFGPSNFSLPLDERPLHMNPCQSAKNVLKAWTDTRAKIEADFKGCRLYPSTSESCASVFANNPALTNTVTEIFNDVRSHLTSFKDVLPKLVESTQCRSLGNNVNDAVDAICSQTLDGVDSIATALWLLGLCCTVMTVWACFLPMFVIPLHNDEEEEEAAGLVFV